MRCDVFYGISLHSIGRFGRIDKGLNVYVSVCVHVWCAIFSRVCLLLDERKANNFKIEFVVQLNVHSVQAYSYLSHTFAICMSMKYLCARPHSHRMWFYIVFLFFFCFGKHSVSAKGSSSVLYLAQSIHLVSRSPFLLQRIISATEGLAAFYRPLVKRLCSENSVDLYCHI